MKIKIYYHERIAVPSPVKEPAGKPPKNVSLDGTDHRLVWRGRLDELDISENLPATKILENIFYRFQDTTPEGFFGSRVSMSIGDIVYLNERGYLCRSHDWMEIPAFVPRVEILDCRIISTDFDGPVDEPQDLFAVCSHQRAFHNCRGFDEYSETTTKAQAIERYTRIYETVSRLATNSNGEYAVRRHLRYPAAPFDYCFQIFVPERNLCLENGELVEIFRTPRKFDPADTLPHIGDEILTTHELLSGEDFVIPKGTPLVVKVVNNAGVTACDDKRFLHNLNHADYDLKLTR